MIMLKMRKGLKEDLPPFTFRGFGALLGLLIDGRFATVSNAACFAGLGSINNVGNKPIQVLIGFPSTGNIRMQVAEQLTLIVNKITPCEVIELPRKWKSGNLKTCDYAFLYTCLEANSLESRYKKNLCLLNYLRNLWNQMPGTDGEKFHKEIFKFREKDDPFIFLSKCLQSIKIGNDDIKNNGHSNFGDPNKVTYLEMSTKEFLANNVFRYATDYIFRLKD